MPYGGKAPPDGFLGLLRNAALLLIGVSVFAPILFAMWFIWFEAPTGSPPDQQLIRFESTLKLLGTVLSWEVIGAAAAWVFRREIGMVLQKIAGAAPDPSKHGL